MSEYVIVQHSFLKKIIHINVFSPILISLIHKRGDTLIVYNFFSTSTFTDFLEFFHPPLLVYCSYLLCFRRFFSKMSHPPRSFQPTRLLSQELCTPSTFIPASSAQRDELPGLFTGPKWFCARPNVLSQPKNLTAFSALSKTFVLAQKPSLLNVWHKMFVTATM